VRSLLVGASTLALAAAVSLLAAVPQAAAEAGVTPGSVSGTAVDGGVKLASSGVDDGFPPRDALVSTSKSDPPPLVQIDCGLSPATSSRRECQSVSADCALAAATAPAGIVMSTIVTYRQTGGGLVFESAACVVQGPAAPGVSEADVRVEVVRRVPSPVVMAAPSGRALVQLESLFWVDTARSVDLGSAGLAGHQVSMTASVESVAWDFGDGARGSSAGPGRPFTKDSHCGQKQCPGWFGHTYTATGSVVVTARVSWSASYRVDGGSAQVISGTVVGSPATMSVVVKQARAVLVPNPNDH